MERDLNRTEARALRDLLAERQDSMLGLTRALVETESPSGDLEGSRAVVSLLAEAAKDTPGVSSVERLESAGYGEHLRVCAFKETKDVESSILLVGHTDTVHPRGSLA